MSTTAEKVRKDLRFDPELLALCQEAAATAGVPLNSWISMILGIAVGFDEQLALAIEVFGTGAVKARRPRRSA